MWGTPKTVVFCEKFVFFEDLPHPNGSLPMTKKNRSSEGDNFLVSTQNIEQIQKTHKITVEFCELLEDL